MKLIYFKVKNSTFIVKDQKILERNFQTRGYLINTTSPFAYFFALIKLILFLLFAGWRYDVFFIRFADWHTAILTFFKKIYKKKLFVVIGGFDVAAIPAFNYGAHLNKRRSKYIKYTLENATCLLPNSESMVFYKNDFIENHSVLGGIKQFAPNTKANIEVVPNGFDSNFWKNDDTREKRKLAITVAVVNSDKNFRMKGIDMFIETAKNLPEYDFLIVGISKEFLRRKELKLPENIATIEYTDSPGLADLYASAKVFCLFSLSEGMPNVLCEAMLCECIPVGTNVTSIPEIIDNTGFVIKNRSLEEHIDCVKKAFNADVKLAKLARERIISNYNISLREEKIVSILRQ